MIWCTGRSTKIFPTLCFWSQSPKIELLSFRKHRKAVAANVRAVRREKEIAAEDVLAKAKICCAETVVVVAQRINHVKTG